MRARLLTLLAAIVLSTGALADNVTYSNARYGTTVSFPGEIFSIELDPPDNGDGQTFEAADGASLAVFASLNVDSLTPSQVLDQAASFSSPEIRITYRTHGRNWAVLSGIAGDKIFYQRFELGSEDVIHSVVITYPSALKADYDPLVGGIANSLTGP